MVECRAEGTVPQATKGVQLEHFRDTYYCRSPHSSPQGDTTLPFLLNINDG